MNAKDIKIGTKFEIEIPEFENRRQVHTNCYVSQLVDIIDDSTVAIAAPIYENRLKFMSNGLAIRVYYLNDRQELICFDAIVNEYKRSGPVETFIIKIIGNYAKIQRRRYYRLNTVLDQSYLVVEEYISDFNSYTFPELKDLPLRNGHTKNISGSGACLLVDESLELGSNLDLTIIIPGYTCVRTIAQVVRVIRKDKKYEVGVHFQKITSKDSEILMKYIFEQQRILLKNAQLEK